MVCIFLGFVASVFADATYNFIISDLSLFNQRERNSAFAKCWIWKSRHTHLMKTHYAIFLLHVCILSPWKYPNQIPEQASELDACSGVSGKSYCEVAGIDPEHFEGLYLLACLGAFSVSLQKNWSNWPLEGKTGHLCLDCCPHKLDPDTWQRMYVGTDGWSYIWHKIHKNMRWVQRS